MSLKLIIHDINTRIYCHRCRKAMNEEILKKNGCGNSVADAALKYPRINLFEINHKIYSFLCIWGCEKNTSNVRRVS